MKGSPSKSDPSRKGKSRRAGGLGGDPRHPQPRAKGEEMSGKSGKPKDGVSRQKTQPGNDDLRRFGSFQPFDLGPEFQMPELADAKRLAERTDAFADSLAWLLGGDNAKERDEIATLWRRIIALPDNVPGELASSAVELWTEGALCFIGCLLVRAERAEPPGNLGQILYELLRSLSKMAGRGNKTAATMWAGRLDDSARDFQKLAAGEPGLFREWARGRQTIPGCISRNPEMRRQNDLLLDKLEQGDAIPSPKPKRGRPVDLSKPSSKLATHLVRYIKSQRRRRTQHFFGIKRISELPKWFRKALRLNEPFSQDNWPKWADVAWDMLAWRMGIANPGLHPYFRDPKTRICPVRQPPLDGADGRSWPPSVHAADTKRKLRAAFKRIAPKT